MEWLSVKSKTHSFLFVESREEREQAINTMKKFELPIKTIVVKAFDNKSQATAYCKKINSVNKLLKNTLGNPL